MSSSHIDLAVTKDCTCPVFGRVTGDALNFVQLFSQILADDRLDFRRSLVSGVPSPRRTAGRVSSKACL